MRWAFEKIHLVILVPNLIRHAACPGLDLHKACFLLVVPRLTHVDLFAPRKASRAAPVETGDEHDEASVQYILNLMIPILSGLDDLMIEEVPVKAVHCLLRTVVPASVDPPLSVSILPSSEDLGHDRFCQIVGISDVYPVPCIQVRLVP